MSTNPVLIATAALTTALALSFTIAPQSKAGLPDPGMTVDGQTPRR